MASPSAFQISQIVLVTVVFIMHLFTLYDLSIYWKINMVVAETSIYGIYFVIIIGYLIALLADGNFAPPLDAMTKLFGAVLFNILGLMTFKHYTELISDHGFREEHVLFGLIKSICSIVVCVLFYIEIFQA